MLGDRVVAVVELLAQRGKLSLAFLCCCWGEVQRRLDAGDVLDLWPDFLLDRFDRGQTPLNAVRQTRQ